MRSTSVTRLAILVVLVFTELGGEAIFAQNSDPLVGTWNITFNPGPSPIGVGVQTFNLGGTTMEYDTAGTNPAASPGESIVLGSWVKTPSGNYDVKEQNYIYDSSGNLKYVAITVFSISIDPTNKHFSGGGVTHFNFCSLSQCPGPLFASAPLQISGSRF